MKFLVVDDSSAMRRIVINALSRIGYTDVVEASSGDDALARFDDSIDFVVTDWSMPGMSGAQLTRSLRSKPAGRAVPIMMVTTRGARDEIIAAIEAGVSSYVLKPFTPSVLKEKIDRLLAITRAAA